MIARTLFILGMIALLNGCSLDVLGTNSSPAYADGYRDGCANGSSIASNINGIVVRDEQRYLNDSEYARAWRAGNRKCNGDNFRSNPNDPMQPIDIDGIQGGYER